MRVHSTRKNIGRYFTPKRLIRYIYYPTVLVIVQKVRETSTNILLYCTVGYCTVQQLDNKSLIRCFGVKYRRIFSLVVFILTLLEGSSKYSTTRKNIRRYFTPKHLIGYMYLSATVHFNRQTVLLQFL